MNLEERLKAALDLRDKEMLDLLVDLNIHETEMCAYLSGAQLMPDNIWHSIARYLDVSPAWLVGDNVPIGHFKNCFKVDATRNNLYLQICGKLSYCSYEELEKVAKFLDSLKIS